MTWSDWIFGSLCVAAVLYVLFRRDPWIEALRIETDRDRKARELYEQLQEKWEIEDDDDLRGPHDN